MTRQIDADATLRYVAFLAAGDPFAWMTPAEAKAETLKQVRIFIEAMVEPQPTFNEIERAAS